jgi:hypothetical protein
LVSVAVRSDGRDGWSQNNNVNSNTPETGNLAQVCFIPVSQYLTVEEEIPILTFFLKPRYVDSWPNEKIIVAAGKTAAEIQLSGQDPGAGLLIFAKWFDMLNLGLGKKIVPLTYNWALTRAWLATWMDELDLLTFFSHEYRDLKAAAMFVNDNCWRNRQEYRVQKSAFSYIAKAYQVPWERERKDAIEDAHAVLRVYNKIITRPLA